MMHGPMLIQNPGDVTHGRRLRRIRANTQLASDCPSFRWHRDSESVHAALVIPDWRRFLEQLDLARRERIVAFDDVDDGDLSWTVIRRCG